MRKPNALSETDFSNLLRSLIYDTQTACFHWHLYKDLQASVQEFHRAFAQSQSFWSLTMSAHSDVTLFRLARLYDKDNCALSLPSLLDTIRENLHFFDAPAFRTRMKDNPFVDSLAADVKRPDEATLAQDRRLVVEDDPLVEKLLQLRNRFLAHRDRHVVLVAPKKVIPPLAVADIDALLDRASRILNRYTVMFEAGSYRMKIWGQDDFKAVLRAVHERCIAFDKRVARQLKRAMAADAPQKRTLTNPRRPSHK